MGTKKKKEQIQDDILNTIIFIIITLNGTDSS